MLFLRSFIFNIVCFVFSILYCGLGVWTLILPRPLFISCIRGYIASISFFERHILHLEYELVGLHHLPARKPYLIASKHQSAWETMKLYYLLDDPAFILKRELLWIPVWGWVAMKVKFIPVNRDKGGASLKALLRASEKAIAEKRSVLIFPQGTRTAPGSKAPYKIGVAALYSHLKVPVVPIAVNSGLFWPKNSFIKRPGKITIEILPLIPAGLSKDDFMKRLERDIETATDKLEKNPLSH